VHELLPFSFELSLFLLSLLVTLSLAFNLLLLLLRCGGLVLVPLLSQFN
jgi:hypothetical protein